MTTQLDRKALWGQIATILQAESRLSSSKAWHLAQEGDRLAEDLGVDSVGQLYLVLALESGLKLQVDDPEAAAEGLKNVAQVVDWVLAQQKT